jgi:hypothetical protein
MSQIVISSLLLVLVGVEAARAGAEFDIGAFAICSQGA